MPGEQDGMDSEMDGEWDGDWEDGMTDSSSADGDFHHESSLSDGSR